MSYMIVDTCCSVGASKTLLTFNLCIIYNDPLSDGRGFRAAATTERALRLFYLPHMDESSQDRIAPDIDE